MRDEDGPNSRKPAREFLPPVAYIAKQAADWRSSSTSTFVVSLSTAASYIAWTTFAHANHHHHTTISNADG